MRNRVCFAFLLLCVALLAPGPAPSNAAEVTIGSGTATWEYPLATAAHDARTQVIYLAAEVGGPCRITALALDVGAIPGQTLSNFTIRLKHTSLSSYSTEGSYDWESSGWTICHQASTTVGTNGWVQFGFTVPFDYDGVSNLMVDISFNNTSASLAGTCRCSEPGGARTLCYKTNSLDGDPLDWTGTTSPTAALDTRVPNVRITIGAAAMPVFSPDGGVYREPQAVSVTCVTPDATIHYTTSGADPTDSDPVVVSGETVTVPVLPPTTLKARAWASGLEPSVVRSASYRLPHTVYVSQSGDDSNEGLSWATAKRSIASALTAASGGDEVWVAGDSGHPYVEKITLKDGVGLYGGFAGTEATRAERDWNVNVTILDGSGAGDVVTAPSGVSASTVLDGFTIRNGSRGIYCSSSSPAITNNTIIDNTGGGIYCYHSSPTITNNMIVGNSATGSYVAGGIYCYSSSPTITNNMIVGNSATGGNVGGGISCSSSSPTIAKNTIVGNSVAGRYGGGGVYCYSQSRPLITNNTIVGNSATGDFAVGGGICCYNSSRPTIANNTISGNGSYGIYCFSSSPTISNNTIAGNGTGIYCDYYSSPPISNNTISGNGTGISCNSSSPTITNNIVAFNGSGVHSIGGTPLLSNNCVFNPDGTDYSGLAAGAGDIRADPEFQSAAYSRLHIQPGSPCVDTGLDSAIQEGWTDLDGQARLQGAHVDIGADESDGTAWPEYVPVVVRVGPTGDDANDGSTWALAKRTVQAGVNAASAAGGEVWVAAGVYQERITLPAYVYLYGGFAGLEQARDERDWSANATVLDGSGAGHVVTALGSYGVSAIDGFTIRNAGMYPSAGIECVSSSPSISNNTITANGAGISCESGEPSITNNTIAGNGRGIDCFDAAPAITNNTIASNAEYGISCCSSSPRITNNIVAFNKNGYTNGAGETPGEPVLARNCFYNPDGSDYGGMAAGEGDISADPMFVDLASGDLHILGTSPCIDAGEDAVVRAGWQDADGQARIQGAHVDIGADEYDGTLPQPAAPAVVRVSPSGADDAVHDGSTWSLAKRTVQAGIESVSASGGEIWVAAGTYDEAITLPSYVYLYGGFAGSETVRGQRDWRMNVSVLGGGDTRHVVTASGGYQVSAIDGFTIRSSSDGFGIYCYYSSPVIANAAITGSYLGISCFSSSPLITNCTISQNKMGVYGSHSSPSITSNTITANAQHGVACLSGAPVITNNTIAANAWLGIACFYGSPEITNNIAAFNGSGVRSIGGTPLLSNNCVFNPDGTDYSGLAAGAGDIRADPLFQSAAYDMLHIQPGSPCVDAGLDDAVQQGWTDMDGQARLQGAHVDIGADESDGTAWPGTAGGRCL